MIWKYGIMMRKRRRKSFKHIICLNKRCNPKTMPEPMAAQSGLVLMLIRRSRDLNRLSRPAILSQTVSSQESHQSVALVRNTPNGVRTLHRIN